MPRYYFDVTDIRGLSEDALGIDCDDFPAAKQQALLALPGIARDQAPGGDTQDFLIEIRDASRRSVGQVRLSIVADGGA